MALLASYFGTSPDGRRSLSMSKTRHVGLWDVWRKWKTGRRTQLLCSICDTGRIDRLVWSATLPFALDIHFKRRQAGFDQSRLYTRVPQAGPKPRMHSQSIKRNSPIPPPSALMSSLVGGLACLALKAFSHALTTTLTWARSMMSEFHGLVNRGCNDLRRVRCPSALPPCR